MSFSQTAPNSQNCFTFQLVVKVLLNDGSSKTLMVDERQNVRDVLDNLFEKTHCDCNVDWSLCETNPELHLGRWWRL